MEAPDNGPDTRRRHRLHSELAPQPQEGFALLDLLADQERLHDEHFFALYESCILPSAAVEKAVEEISLDYFNVRAHTDASTFYLSFDAKGVRCEFDDNCLALLRGE